jgi:hypothetical protein
MRTFLKEVGDFFVEQVTVSLLMHPALRIMSIAARMGSPASTSRRCT